VSGTTASCGAVEGSKGQQGCCGRCACNPSACGPGANLERVAALLERCHTQALALAGHEIASEPVFVLGLAGATEAGAQPQVTAGLPYRNVIVRGDIDIAAKGAFPDGDGIVMAVGTGAVLARQSADGIVRVGGHGLLLGDEGSGAWIGRAALRRCLLAQDGLGENGPLTRLLWARFGRVGAIIRFAADARPADFAALAPVVLEQAQAHCPVACAILDAACAYFRGAIRQLQGGCTDLPVAATGGLGPILLERMIQQGGGALHRAEPAGTALDGALWFARHHFESTKP